jgi:hypothetical protein
LKLDGKLSALGGDRVLFSGRNLGFGFPRVAGATSNDSTSSLPSFDAMLDSYAAGPRRLPLYESQMVPGFGTLLMWSKVCMTASKRYLAAKPPSGWPMLPYAEALCVNNPNQLTRNNRDMERFTILSHTHNAIVVRSHPGIGRNRNVSLSFHGPLASTGVVSSQSDPPFTFSYDAPQVTAIREVPILVGAPIEPRSAVAIEVYADNIGSTDDEGELSPEETVPVLMLGTELASEPRRVLAGVEGQGRILGPHIAAVVRNQTVGYQSVSLQIAGQTGYLAASDPLAPLVACASGYFGNISETCMACPLGALCEGYDRVRRVHRFPRALPKYFVLNSTSVTWRGAETTMYDLACPNKTLGRPAACVVGCVPSEACVGDNFCAIGYRSAAPDFRCSNCEQGFYRRNGECIRCPDAPILMVIGFCVLAVFVVACGYILNRKAVNVAFLSIGVDYFQVLSMFAQSRIAWPPQIKEFFHLLSAFNLNIEITSPECLLPDTTYVQKFSAVMTLPLAAGFIFASIFVGRYCFARFIMRQRGRSFLTRHSHALVSAMLMICYFMYLSISRTLLEVFNCVPATPDDGRLYLAAGRGLETCPGDTQATLIPFAAGGIIL